MAGIKYTTPSKEAILLGNNVKTLREHKKETQQDLADILGVSSKLISCYELGTRKISKENIQIIAEHYGIDLETLINEEVNEAWLEEWQSLLDDDCLIRFFKSTFRRFKTDQDIENQNFKRGDELLSQYLRGESTMSTILNSARNRFYKSYKDAGLLNGAANTLMLILMEFATIDLEQEFVDKIATSGISKSDLLVYNIKRSSALSDKQVKFIKSTEDIYDECLFALRSNKKINMYEYFLMLRYYYGMVDNGLTPVDNAKVAYAMIYELYRCENTYAKRLVAFLDTL